MDREKESLASCVRIKSHSTGKIYRIPLDNDVSGIQLKSLVQQSLPEEFQEEYEPSISLENRELSDEEMLSPSDSPILDIFLKRYPTYIDYLLQNQRLSHRLIFKTILSALGSLFIAACAQMSFYLPFDKTVPVTMQTFSVLLSSVLLGPWFGMLCVGLYIFEGGVGAPFFAKQSGGIEVLSGTTSGYIFGFILTPLITGWFAKLSWDRKFHTCLVALLCGNIAVYVIGVPVLAHFIGWKNAFLDGFVPFLLGDALKIVMAVVLIPLLWKLTALVFNLNHHTIISYRDYC